MIHDLTDENYSDFVQTTDNVIFIDFYTQTCPSCVELMPLLDRLDANFIDKAEICRVNVSQNPKLAQKYSIRSVPVCVVIGKDKMVKEAELGVNSVDHYFSMIERAIGKKLEIVNIFSRIFGKK